MYLWDALRFRVRQSFRHKRKNQPRIPANLRESHFPCVRVLCSGLCVQIEDLRAASNRLCLFGLRLRRNRTLSGKMLGKNPPAGFSSLILYSSFLIRGAGPRLRRGAARGGDILFAEGPIRFQVGHQE